MIEEQVKSLLIELALAELDKQDHLRRFPQKTVRVSEVSSDFMKNQLAEKKDWSRCCKRYDAVILSLINVGMNLLSNRVSLP